MRISKVIPTVMATALFMDLLDTSTLGSALPSLAAQFHTTPLPLKLALTNYLMTMAVFVPASGWLADRYGARRGISERNDALPFGLAVLRTVEPSRTRSEAVDHGTQTPAPSSQAIVSHSATRIQQYRLSARVRRNGYANRIRR